MTKPFRTPGQKALHTAKWARIMTKWLITWNHKKGARWNLVEFGGKTGAESRGIVDLLAVRKNHKPASPGLKRGDLLDIVLIQTKGGSARPPTAADIERLAAVAKYHRAKAVVLASWRRKKSLELFKLERGKWKPVTAHEVFG